MAAIRSLFNLLLNIILQPPNICLNSSILPCGTTEQIFLLGRMRSHIKRHKGCIKKHWHLISKSTFSSVGIGTGPGLSLEWLSHGPSSGPYGAVFQKKFVQSSIKRDNFSDPFKIVPSFSNMMFIILQINKITVCREDSQVPVNYVCRIAPHTSPMLIRLQP